MTDKGYIPPYTITDEILNLVSDITEILTKLTIDDKMNYNPRLKRDNRVKTIHASLAIENNSLSIEQVTDIIAGKRVLGPQNEICEVKNAFEAYEHLLELNPYLIKDMLKAHKMLMHDLTKEAGTFRQGGVGVFAGDRLVHMAPPAERVPQLIKELIDWLKNDKAHPLIKSCVFHYEFIQSTEYCMSKVEDDFMAKMPKDVEDLWRFIDEIPYWTAKKHGKKYRLMYQVYTHPKYRQYGQGFFKGVDKRYTEYAKILEDNLGIPYQKLTPLIFVLIRACVHYALFEDEFYLKSQIEVLKESLELFVMKHNPKAMSGAITE